MKSDKCTGCQYLGLPVMHSLLDTCRHPQALKRQYCNLAYMEKCPGESTDWYQVIKFAAPGVRLLGIVSNDNNDEEPMFFARIWVLDESIYQPGGFWHNSADETYNKTRLADIRKIKSWSDFAGSLHFDFHNDYVYANNSDTGSPRMEVAKTHLESVMKKMISSIKTNKTGQHDRTSSIPGQ